MMSSVNIVAADHSNAIWNNEVPLNVSLFAWRLLRNRLPTTNNLIRRHILHHNAQLCVGGYDVMEDIDHLFLS
ncbi:putative reverse transcriptase zinc-binding domain-containing protein [Medicago truncatula]|uniref:Putative reverse transcriptase zinc-binding domain-containing protein n=1 Tax=Medicago truncatula TaxID=3880 RepID=A0A396IYM7_MEDTR|nr:putative reverse transcriptase zinc-binding domain-containing protein [Medicago truncatula]